MTIQTFVEKIVQGGWLPKEFPLEEKPEDIGINVLTDKELEERDEIHPIQFFDREYPEEGYIFAMSLSELVLRTKAWRAIGKIEGWNDGDCAMMGGCQCDNPKSKMREMIEVLNRDKTIEQFIETL